MQKYLSFPSCALLLALSFAPLTSFAVNKGTLMVNENVTTHVIMPENIKLVDVSTPEVVGNQCASNIVRIKPNVIADSLGRVTSNFNEYQMIGTITIIGERSIAQYDVVYTSRPSMATSLYSVPYAETRSYQNQDVAMPEKEIARYCWAIYGSGRHFNNISNHKHGIRAYVNNIYSIGNYFFIDYTLENKTKIKYEIAEVRVSLSDKKQSKATNTQQIELLPVYSMNYAKSFKKTYRNVLVLDKLTFPEEKVLTIEISENQISGRVIELQIEYEDILHADGISDGLMDRLDNPNLPHANIKDIRDN